MALLLVIEACEHEIMVEYRNDLQQHVSIFKDGRFQFAVKPRSSEKVALLKKDWIPEVRIVSADGQVLLDDNITMEELKAMDYKIVITDPVTPGLMRTSARRTPLQLGVIVVGRLIEVGPLSSPPLGPRGHE